MHRVASTYGCRPSAVLGVRDGWTAYQLDVTCMLVGVTEEAQLAREAQRKAGVPGAVESAASPGEDEHVSLRHLARSVTVREKNGGWDD